MALTPRLDRTRLQPGVREDVQAGLAALQQNDLETAREIFSGLLEEDPRLAAAHVGLGRVYTATGDSRKALEHYDEALAIQPEFPSVRMMASKIRSELRSSQTFVVEEHGDDKCFLSE